MWEWIIQSVIYTFHLQKAETLLKSVQGTLGVPQVVFYSRGHGGMAGWEKRAGKERRESYLLPYITYTPCTQKAQWTDMGHLCVVLFVLCQRK